MTGGRGRRVLRRVVASGGLVAFAGLAAPADAQTGPPPPSDAPATTAPAAGPPTTVALPAAPFGGSGGFLVPEWATGEMADPCTPAEPGGASGSASSIVPDDCWGALPSSGYDIGFDEGAWNHIDRKVYGSFTDMAFQTGRSATALSLWMLEWAYGFEVYDRLGGAAVEIGESYERDLIGPLGLAELAWFYAVAWASVTALRGRLTMAAGELVVSVVIAGLAGLLLANPAGYMDGTFDTIGRASAALLATGTGQPPPADGVAADGVLAPLQAQIHRSFVEDPYVYLNWGGPLPPACAAMADRIVANGPHGSSDEPRLAMGTAGGCDEQVDFNAQPTGTRLFGAVLTLTAAAVMTVLVALISLTVIVAQVLVVILFALAPFALLAGILPGGGRELAWRWVAALARAALAVLGMSFVLSLLLLSVDALLEASADVGLVERFALVTMVVVAMLVARKRVLAAGHNLAAGFGQRLATRRVGGERSTPWGAAPVAAGATGFAVGAAVGPDRPTRTGRAASQAWRDHRMTTRMGGARRGTGHRPAARSGAHAGGGPARRVRDRVNDRRDRPAGATVRERSEVRVGADGTATTQRVVSVDGPAARSRRARRARERIETRAGRDLGPRPASPPRRAWSALTTLGAGADRDPSPGSDDGGP